MFLGLDPIASITRVVLKVLGYPVHKGLTCTCAYNFSSIFGYVHVCSYIHAS